ncbi:carotenoid biosynthesis protein [Nonomuraea sp. NPDC048892]|uniref:carotenoid biosynthesis protein n=1 Tax=Nonomuraea sp. NPDC048892 TaxID=3154624 RepID=UPI0034063378
MTTVNRARPAQKPPPRNGWTVAARILTAIASLVAVIQPALGITTPVVMFFAIPLTVVLARRRYGWRMTGQYYAVTFAVANIFENLSISTGFPFGDYYYPGSSPRIGNFPIQVALAYCSLAMVCWLTTAALFDNADQRLSDRNNPARRVDIVALPAVAAAMMTMFDLGTDSVSSTIQKNWIWDHGGAVFGVPWTNYLGWWFVTYLFFQIFALMLAGRRSVDPGLDNRRSEPVALAVAIYFLLAATTMTLFFTQSDSTVTDAVGHTWDTDDIYGTMFTFNLFGPVVIVIIAVTRIIRSALIGAPERAESRADSSPLFNTP